MTAYAGAVGPQYSTTPADDLPVGTLVTATNGQVFVKSAAGAGGWQLQASSSPGGTTGKVQFNNAGTMAGAAQVEVEGGYLRILNSVPSTTPAAGGIDLCAIDMAGRIMPAYLPPVGALARLQPSLAHKRYGIIQAGGNSTTITNLGISAPTNIVAPVAVNVATTNLFATMRRANYSTTTTAGNVNGGRGNSQFFLGNSTTQGGFYSTFRFGCANAAAVAGHRQFVGYSASSAAPTNIDPSSGLNQFGVGLDAADTNLQMMTNDGTGVSTKVDLGVNFPGRGLSTEMYDLTLFAAPNSATVGWRVERLGTAFTAVGTITTDLPAVNTLLTPHWWISNNATALAASLAFCKYYVETEY